MLHPYSLILSVLLATCAVFAGLIPQSIFLVLIIVLKSPRSPCSAWFVASVMILSGLQILSSIVINVIASSSSSISSSLFGDNRDLLALLGILEASSERTGKFVGSTIPSAVTLIYCAVMRKRLTTPLHVSPVNNIYSVALWCVVSAVASLVAPSAMGFGFFILSVGVGLLLTFGSRSIREGDATTVPRHALQILSNGSCILGSLVIGAICIAQNSAVANHVFSRVDPTIGLSQLFDLDADDAVRRGLQLLLMILTVLMSHALTEFRHGHHHHHGLRHRDISYGAAVDDPLLFEAAQEQAAGSVRGRAKSVTSNTTGSAFSASDLIGRLQKYMRRFGEFMLHNLIIIPFFPFVCIAANIVAFPTISSMLLLPFMFIGLLVTDIALLAQILTWTVLLYAPWLGLQGLLISLFEERHQQSTFFKLFVSQQSTGWQTLECGASLLVYFVLLATLSQQRSYQVTCQTGGHPVEENKSKKHPSRTRFTNSIRSVSDSCNDDERSPASSAFVEGPTERALRVLGPSCVKDLFALLGVTGIADDIDVNDAFFRLVGRPADTFEVDLLCLNAHPIAALIERRIEVACTPMWRQFSTHLTLLLQYYSTALSVFLIFISGSCIRHLDFLHCVALLLFLFYFAFPRTATRWWLGIVAYVMLLTLAVNIFSLIAPFVTFPDYLASGIRSRTVGLVPLENRWFAIPYFAVVIFVAVQRKLSKTMYQSWDDVVAMYEWRQCAQLPMTIKWRQRFTMALAVGVFVGLGLFEQRSLLVEGFLGLFLLICVGTAYNIRQGLLCQLWRFATLYSVCTILAVSAYQFQDIRTRVDSVFSSDTMSEVGVVAPDGKILTFFLAPWFIALTVSIIHLQSVSDDAADPTIRRIILSKRLVSVSAASDGKDMSELGDFDHFTNPDQKFFMVLRKCFAAMEALATWCGAIGADCGDWIVWVGLYTAATSRFTLMNSGYALFLILDITNIPSLLYCVAHLLVLYTYQFSFVPKINGTFNGVDMAELVGFFKSDGQEAASTIFGPVFAFFAILCRVCTRDCKCSWQKDDDKETLDTSSWRAFVLRQIIAVFGYEIFLVLVLLSISFSAHVASAAPQALLLIYMVKKGRAKYYESTLTRLVAYTVVSASLGFELMCEIGASNKLYQLDGDSTWKYWGLEGRIGALFSVFLALCLLHATKRTQAAIADIEAMRQLYKHETLIEYMVSNSASALQHSTPERFEELVPKLAPSAQGSCRGLCMTCLETLFSGASPAAFFSFAAGSQEASLINVGLLMAGLVQFSSLEKLHWNFFITWPKLAKAYLVLIAIPLIVNIPPVVDWSRNNPHIASIIGIADPDGVSIGLSNLRVCLMVAVFLQTRLYEDFHFEIILRHMFYDVSRRQEKHELLMKHVQDLHERDLQLADEHSKELREKLMLIRDATAKLGLSQQKAEDKQNSESDKPNADGGASGVAPVPLDHESAEDDQKPVSAQGPIKERLIRMVRDGAEEVTAHLAHLTFNRHKFTAANYPSIWSRMARVFVGILERHTAELVLMAAVVDFAHTGNIIDAVPVFLLVGIAPSYSPFPPLAIYNFLSQFVVIGIVVKAAVAVISTQVELSTQLAKLLSWTIIDLPVDPDTGVPITGQAESYRRLIYTFVVFALIVIHRHVSFANGVYAPDHLADIGEEDEAGNGEDERNNDAAGGSPAAADPEEAESFLLHAARDFYYNCIAVRGVGRDFYLLYSCIDAVALIVFTMDYYTISGYANGSIIQNVQDNLLPGAFVMVLMASLLCMLADRMLYVSQNMQGKLGFNIGVTLAYIIVFVWWSNSIVPTSTISGIAYFVIKCLYIYISCLQLRYGFPLHRRHDPFTNFPEDILRWLGYTIFRAVPFLYEIRVTSDWSIEKTSLTLPAYLHVEDLHDIIYNRYVMMVDAKERQPILGTAIRWRVKLMDGASRLIIMLVLILFPLMYYSTFNPSLQDNSVTQLSMSLSFGSTSFFQSNLLSIPRYPGDLSQWIARTRPLLGSYDLSGNGKTVQLMDLSSCSTEIWTLSPQGHRALNTSLLLAAANKTSLDINVRVEVTRISSSAGSSATQSLVRSWPIPWDTASNLQRSIEELSGDSNSNVTRLPNFYSPYIFNQPTKVNFFNTLEGDPMLDTEDCSIELRAEKDTLLETEVRYWCLKCNSIFSNGNFPNNSAAFPEWPCITQNKNCQNYNFEEHATNYTPVPMYYVVYSEPVPSTISFLPNIGIIAIYTSFVVVIGRMLRGMFSGTTQNVIQSNMADPKPVAQLVEYIAIARECRDFKLEQSLYFELLDLLRSPERLLLVTGLNRRLYDDEGFQHGSIHVATVDGGALATGQLGEEAETV